MNNPALLAAVLQDLVESKNTVIATNDIVARISAIKKELPATYESVLYNRHEIRFRIVSDATNNTRALETINRKGWTLSGQFSTYITFTAPLLEKPSPLSAIVTH